MNRLWGCQVYDQSVDSPLWSLKRKEPHRWNWRPENASFAPVPVSNMLRMEEAKLRTQRAVVPCLKQVAKNCHLALLGQAHGFLTQGPPQTTNWIQNKAWWVPEVHVLEMKRSHLTTFKLLIQCFIRVGVNGYPFLPVFTSPLSLWLLRTTAGEWPKETIFANIFKQPRSFISIFNSTRSVMND